jgi:hypothetical protein
MSETTYSVMPADTWSKTVSQCAVALPITKIVLALLLAGAIFTAGLFAGRATVSSSTPLPPAPLVIEQNRCIPGLPPIGLVENTIMAHNTTCLFIHRLWYPTGCYDGDRVNHDRVIAFISEVSRWCATKTRGLSISYRNGTAHTPAHYIDIHIRDTEAVRDCAGGQIIYW